MAEFPEGYSEFGTALADGDFALVNKRKTLISRFWTYIQSKLSAGAVTVGSLVTSGTVDGRDVSTDGATLDAHVASTSNPHAVTAAQAGAVAIASHAALSVVGRSANSTGDAADIAAANDGEVLRRSGTSIGFGTIATAGIGDAQVTEAKLSSALQATIAALIDTADPLSVFGSYGTVLVTGAWTDLTVHASHPNFLGVNSSGSGAGLQPVAAPANRVGVVSLNTGTATTGYNTLWSSAAPVRLGSGAYRWRSDVRIPTASDGTDTFSVRVGFHDAGFAAGAAVDGAYFRYTHSENGGNWTAVTVSNSVETGTATNTGVAGVSASAFQALEIEVNAAASSVVFKIDGATVATHTGNIPSGSGRETGMTIHIVKSAGTNNRQVDVDNAGYRYERSAAI